MSFIIKKRFFALMVMGLLSFNSFAITIDPGRAVGIRGNGEFFCAHFGALARMVEEYGAFGTVSGGSSASITVFLYESALLNPALACSDEEQAKERLAFLIKSFEGYADSVPQMKNFAELFRFVKLVNEVKSGINQIISVHDLNSVRELPTAAYKVASLLKILWTEKNNPIIRKLPEWELFTNLLNYTRDFVVLPTAWRFYRVKNTILQIKESFDVFAKFDSKNDEALFLRPGLIDFKTVAEIFGQMGDFYASYDQELWDGEGRFQALLEECAENSRGYEWDVLSKRVMKSSGKSCGEELTRMALAHDQAKARSHHRINDFPGKVDDRLTIIISTSLIRDLPTVSKWREAKKNYSQGESSDKWQFRPDYESIRYGYWVKSSKQQRMQSYLKRECERTHDLLACKGEIIGDHPWRYILALSPAEPGLARVQEFASVYPREELIRYALKNTLSLGGWSDLFPNTILKASGSTSETLITRRGYHTFFGQGVMIRLGVNDLSFDELAYLHEREVKHTPSSPEFEHASGEILNPTKRTTGVWARGYNLHNPESSFNQALVNSGAVVCTHWDWGSLSNWRTMIKDAYNATIYVKDTAAFPHPEAGHPSLKVVAASETQRDLTASGGGRYFDLSNYPGAIITPDHPWFNRGCTGIDTYSETLPFYETPFHKGESLKTPSFPF
ncbi:MAG: hypothetical protein HQK50_16455 [Oligoflexia bacterium]|nr:hypothetical protein [Oligoflexia bacterium]